MLNLVPPQTLSCAKAGVIAMEKPWHEFAVEDVWAKPSSQADPQQVQVSRGW